MECLRTRLAIDNRTFTPSGIGAKAKLGIARFQGLAHATSYLIAECATRNPDNSILVHRISPL